MKLVIIESPYSGATAANKEYARDALLDCLQRGEAPLASHLLYTQVLDDTIPNERAQGMAAGWAWIGQADKVAVYTDFGITPGMQQGIDLAVGRGLEVEYRELGVKQQNG